MHICTHAFRAYRKCQPNLKGNETAMNATAISCCDVVEREQYEFPQLGFRIKFESQKKQILRYKLSVSYRRDQKRSHRIWSIFIYMYRIYNRNVHLMEKMHVSEWCKNTMTLLITTNLSNNLLFENRDVCSIYVAHTGS